MTLAPYWFNANPFEGTTMADDKYGNYTANEKQGYHQFVRRTSDEDSEWYGSFEVFWHSAENLDESLKQGYMTESGWYWWACFPGCMPDDDGQVNGPFATSQEAYDNAQEGA